ncbi:lipopolysaccharide transport system ATP-binding protein [Pseudomonas sp. TE3786]
MCSDVVIQVENLSKCYQVYEKPHDRLKQFFLPPLQRLLGLPAKQYYREFWALRDVSLKVNKGEAVAIIGYNGSGKSTLLQLVCGTLNPTTGSVQTAGRVAALLELGSGFNPEFTGRENVYLNAAILGLSKQEIDSKFAAIAEFSEIGEFMEQPVRSYSSGMYVRLAFSIIANVDADVLIIDEALAVGDIQFAQKCMRFLHEFKTRGSLLFVSHDPAAVLSLCEHALWLEKGILKGQGVARSVTNQYLAGRYNSPSIAAGSTAVDAASNAVESQGVSTAKHDMRMKFINASNLRNDLQLVEFNPHANGFGDGGAVITQAQFLDAEKQPLAWVVGGECVSIVVDASIHSSNSHLIVGFQVKNRLGQVLFGQNTYLPGFNAPVSAEAGDAVRAVFTFDMPVLAVGTYSVDIAIAQGIPPDVQQLQWLHDALVIESRTSSVVSGIGLPYKQITLGKI